MAFDSCLLFYGPPYISSSPRISLSRLWASMIDIKSVGASQKLFYNADSRCNCIFFHQCLIVFVTPQSWNLTPVSFVISGSCLNLSFVIILSI